MTGRRYSAEAAALTLAGVMLLMVAGCQNEAESPPVKTSAAVAPAEPADLREFLTADELRRRLRTDDRATFRRVGQEIVEARLVNSGIQSIEPLTGLPLRYLDLGFCEHIHDLSALRNMPLKTLILEGTSVEDLSPLAGMPLEVLFLQDTHVTDLSVVSGLPLKELNLKGVSVSDVGPFAELKLTTLWIPDTDIADISRLQGMKLASLDVQDTPVSDVGVLAEMKTLRRLNIAGSRVSDITPLSSLRLDRIILSPENITVGMEGLREMKSLNQIWTSHQNQMTADSFWERYDLGLWDRAAEIDDADDANDADDDQESTDQDARGKKTNDDAEESASTVSETKPSNDSESNGEPSPDLPADEPAAPPVNPGNVDAE